MKNRTGPLALCLAPAVWLALAGCAGPLEQTWDDRAHRALRERYAEHDRAIADGAAVDAPRPATGLDGLERLTVEDAIRIGVANSPRLRQAGYMVDAAGSRVTQAGLWPNPTLAFEAEGLGSDAGGGGETVYRVEQEVVLGGRLRRARDVAEVDRLAARAAFEAEEFAVAARVTRAYFDAAASAERLVRREELVELARQLVEAAEAREQAGAATEADRLRAELVAEQARIELVAAMMEESATRRALAAAMGVGGSVDLPLASAASDLPQLPGYDALVEAAMARSGRVVAAELALERARSAHRLARATAAPTLVASVGPRYSDIEHETTMDVGLAISLPLVDRNQGGIGAALSERLSAAAALHAARLEVQAEVALAWAEYQAAHVAAMRYRSYLLPMAERSLELTREAYEHGKGDYLRLLDAQQVVVESRIAHVDALRRLHSAAATLRELARTDASWLGSGDAGSEVDQ